MFACPHFPSHIPERASRARLWLLRTSPSYLYLCVKVTLTQSSGQTKQTRNNKRVQAKRLNRTVIDRKAETTDCKSGDFWHGKRLQSRSISPIVGQTMGPSGYNGERVNRRVAGLRALAIHDRLQLGGGLPMWPDLPVWTAPLGLTRADRRGLE